MSPMPDGRGPVRIAIADDHPIFRDGLTRLLVSEPGFEVVGEASTGVEAIRMTEDLRPDVLLLDVAMPELGGVDALPSIDLGATRVILLTALIDPADLLRAIQLGVRGAILKESAPQRLLDGIHRVMRGQYVLGDEVAHDLASAVAQTDSQQVRQFGLTPRELEIVSAIAGGDSNRQIAERLGITLPTVKNHLTSIFDKVGVSTRLELALVATRRGLKGHR